MRKKIALFILLMAVLFFSSTTLSQRNPAFQAKPRQSQPQAGQPQTKLEPLQKTQGSIRLLPDLVVDQIWLDNQCQINFRLRNAGMGAILEPEYRASVTRVQFSVEIRDFGLITVDPSGHLKNAGGIIAFNSKIVLKTPLSAKVTADFNRRIPEPDAGEKNNELAARLTPQCSAGQTQFRAVGGQPRVGAGAANESLSGKNNGLPIGKNQGNQSSKSDAPLQKKPTLNFYTPGQGTKADSGPTGIKVTAPVANAVLLTYSLVSVEWKALFTSATEFRIKLVGKTGAGVGNMAYATLSPDASGSYKYDCKIPGYHLPGDYAIEVSTIDYKFYGVSGLFHLKTGPTPVIPPYTGPSVVGFSVHEPGWYIKDWRTGAKRQVEWHIDSVILNDPKSLDLMQETVRIVLKDTIGNELATLANSAPNGKWDAVQYKNCTIPAGTRDGQYIIRVETPDHHFYGESNPFTIWNAKTLAVKPKGKPDSAQPQLKQALNTPLPPQVTHSIKTLSIKPYLANYQLISVDLEVEIDASSDFQIIGKKFPSDPILKPVSLSPVIQLTLKHKVVRVDKYNSFNKDFQAQLPPSVGEEGILLHRTDLNCDNAVVCPSGVIKKGKSKILFTIKTTPIPAPANGPTAKEFWGPYTFKRNFSGLVWNSSANKWDKMTEVLSYDCDLIVEAGACIADATYPIPFLDLKNIMQTIVSQPRGYKYVQW